MFSFSSSKAVEFLPDEEARAWLAESLGEVRVRLGEPATRPRLLTETPVGPARDMDDLFSLICAVQAEIGQEKVEFSLIEFDATTSGRQVPDGFEPLGQPTGQLLHTFAHQDELVILAVPALLRVPALVLASVARELGRIALARSGRANLGIEDVEAAAELASIALGMGLWIANGSYVYENACCGGGCGLDLKNLRAALSLPEACFALALDTAHRKIPARVAARHLESTQKAAFKRSAGFVAKATDLLQLVAGSQPALVSP